MALIELKHLTRCYGDRIVVDDISVKLVNNQIYGLLGPDGAGKSTLMDMMSGCLAPTEGTVRINGFDVSERPVQAKRLLGYMPQQMPLYPHMTVREYLEFIAGVKGIWPPSIGRMVDETVEVLHLGEVEGHLIKRLSKGCCRRVGLAMALLGDPEIMLLDEPIRDIEAEEVAEIWELMRSLGEKHTVILSGSDPADMRAVCDQVLLMCEGKLVAQVTPDELVQETAGEDGDATQESEEGQV